MLPSVDHFYSYTICFISLLTGKVLAAQAIARIGINHPPSVAFPGQRMFEVVKPLIGLLDLERKGLENFEALLTLANIASESEACRNRIFEEAGFMQIEHYMYEDHVKLRMAAVQCMLNLCLSERTVKVSAFQQNVIKIQ